MSDYFFLKWNDFQSTVSQSFNTLRQEEEFYDVTLVSEDEVQLFAHKLVLSACSSFFKNILKKNVHQSPLIYLRGISSNNMKKVLDYIYCGEVQIFYEQVDSFLEVAKELKISGLLPTAGEDSEIQKHENVKGEVVNNEQMFESKNEIYKVLKSSPFININTKERQISYHITDNTSVGSGPETDERVNEILIKEAGIIKCMTCGKTGNHSSTMKRHAETHLEGLSYSCPTCDKTFRYNNIYKFIIQFGQQHN